MRAKVAKKLRQIAKKIVGNDEVKYDVLRHRKHMYHPDIEGYYEDRYQIRHNEHTWKSVYKVLKQGHTKRHNYA